MKKLNIVLVLLVVFCLVGFKRNTTIEDPEVKEATRLISDLTSPTITFKNEDGIILAENQKLVLSDFIDVEDEDDNVNVTSFGEVNLSKAGTYTMNIIAMDSSKNITSIDAEVKVLKQEEYDALMAQKERQRIIEEEKEQAVRRNAMREYLAADTTEKSNTDIYNLALNYLGMEGQCVAVARAFMNEYMGYNVNIYDTYTVSYDEAQPGDIIEYANGGNGLSHVAVYLGGGKALHGNWKGTTVIADAIVSGATDPIFKRLK